MEFNDIENYLNMKCIANYALRTLRALDKWTEKELAEILKKKFLWVSISKNKRRKI